MQTIRQTLRPIDDEEILARTDRSLMQQYLGVGPITSRAWGDDRRTLIFWRYSIAGSHLVQSGVIVESREWGCVREIPLLWEPEDDDYTALLAAELIGAIETVERATADDQDDDYDPREGEGV